MRFKFKPSTLAVGRALDPSRIPQLCAMYVLTSALIVAASAAAHSPSVADLQRAKTRRPIGSSHVAGETAEDAFAKMNKVLVAGAAKTRACHTFDHASLNALTRRLYGARSAELDDMYKAREDKRALHFTSLDYKEQLWHGEAAAASLHSSHAEGGASYNATRDGKCAEAVMWYIHHIAEPVRALLAKSEDFVLPLMPTRVAHHSLGGHEYALQISCTDCHVPVQQPGKPPMVKPTPRPGGSGPQYQEDCSNSTHGIFHKDYVWYNRTKRCDWDYEPFCSPCEGVGGLVWGNGEHDWNPMPCEPLMKPEEIPKENLTSPLWPKHFTVQEKAMLTFPGRDPCNVNFRNSTYTLAFTTTEKGPIYHTIGKTGPSGPSPFPGKSWALYNGNFYNTVDLKGKSEFCICLGPEDPVVENAITGPLSWDFNRGAKLVGRERIVPEYLGGGAVVADHWVKGPHHFWIDVSTNRMLREWQPFNGHQIYYDWDLAEPAPEVINVEDICLTGLRRVNVSCPAGPPSPSLQSLIV